MAPHTRLRRPRGFGAASTSSTRARWASDRLRRAASTTPSRLASTASGRPRAADVAATARRRSPSPRAPSSPRRRSPPRGPPTSPSTARGAPASRRGGCAASPASRRPARGLQVPAGRHGHQPPERERPARARRPRSPRAISPGAAPAFCASPADVDLDRAPRAAPRAASRARLPSSRASGAPSRPCARRARTGRRPWPCSSAGAR